MHKNDPELVYGAVHPLQTPYYGLRVEIYFPPKRYRSLLFIVTSCRFAPFEQRITRVLQTSKDVSTTVPLTYSLTRYANDIRTIIDIYSAKTL